MTELDEKQQRGLEFITEVMGEKFGEGIRTIATGDGFGSQIARMSAGWAFSDAWLDQGLQRKEKSIAVIALLIALRQEAELKNHVKIGVANGLTVSELEGLLIQVTPYVGLPSVASATTAVIEALREEGILLDGIRTHKEMGLL